MERKPRPIQLKGMKEWAPAHSSTLSSLLQSLATIVTGAIIGLCYGPRVAGVAIACLPLVIANGYVELRIVKLRGLAQQAAHERSAQLACEAAGAVRTVQSLTAEERLSEGYAESLAQSKAQVTRTAFLDGGIYGLSQALSFFVIALVSTHSGWDVLPAKRRLVSLRDLGVGLLVWITTGCVSRLWHYGLLRLRDGELAPLHRSVVTSYSWHPSRL